MDDIDGWPAVNGRRLRHETDEEWTVTLTPQGLEMKGPRQALVSLDCIGAVRQRPAGHSDGSGADATVFEIEWWTALEEHRTLSLLCRDRPAAERLVTVLAGKLEELDVAGGRRGVDWVLVVLLATGLGVAIRNLTRSTAPETAYEWTATVVQFAADLLAVPFLYLLARALVRWLLRRS